MLALGVECGELTVAGARTPGLGASGGRVAGGALEARARRRGVLRRVFMCMCARAHTHARERERERERECGWGCARVHERAWVCV